MKKLWIEVLIIAVSINYMLICGFDAFSFFSKQDYYSPNDLIYLIMEFLIFCGCGYALLMSFKRITKVSNNGMDEYAMLIFIALISKLVIGALILLSPITIGESNYITQRYEYDKYYAEFKFFHTGYREFYSSTISREVLEQNGIFIKDDGMGYFKKGEASSSEYAIRKDYEPWYLETLGVRYKQTALIQGFVPLIGEEQEANFFRKTFVYAPICLFERFLDTVIQSVLFIVFLLALVKFFPKLLPLREVRYDFMTGERYEWVNGKREE